MGLSDSERISMMHSAVLIQYTRVTDRQTDRHTELALEHTRYSIYAVARKNCILSARIDKISSYMFVYTISVTVSRSSGTRRSAITRLHPVVLSTRWRQDRK